MREREKLFVNYFLEELKDGDVDGAADKASKRMGWTAGGYELLKDKARLRRARNILSKPGTIETIQKFFETSTGFTPMNAAAMLVDHIEGNIEITREVQTATGEVKTLRVKIPPSLDALKTYINLAIPKQATSIKIDSKQEVRAVLVSSEPPRTVPRVLENVTGTLPPKELPP